MKRIGTITTAVGLICYGMLLILYRINSVLSEEIIKLWPALIILLGIEVLLNRIFNNSEQRRRFNGWAIVVVILFAVTDGGFVVKNNIPRWGHFSDPLSFTFDIDSENVPISTSLECNKQKVKFKTNNANIDIKKSSGNSLKFEGSAKLTSKVDEYNIDVRTDTDTIILDLDKGDIKRVSGTLYIPDNIDLYVDVNNLNIDNDDNFNNGSIFIDSNNGKIDIQKFKKATIEAGNSDVNIKDIYESKMKLNNGKVDIEGEAPIIDINGGNGKVSIDNNKTKDIKVSNNNGIISLKTKEKNFNIDARVNTGSININDKKTTGSKASVNQTIGSDENKIKLQCDSGKIDVKYEE
jgi:hypothetical protein